MVEMAEEHELLELIEKISHNIQEPNKEIETRHLSEKIQRLKSVLKKKDEIRNNLKDELNNLREEKNKLNEEIEKLKSAKCNECDKHSEVERNQSKMLDDKDKELKSIRNRNIAILSESKKKKKMLKDLEKVKENLNSKNNKLQSTTDALTKENNELKAANSTLQTLLEALDKQDKDVDEVEVVKSVTLNKDTSGHLCVTCDKRFLSNNNLERHIEEKHDVHECPMCDEICTNKKELERHVGNCMNDILVMETCQQCKKRLSKPALRRHKRNKECQKNNAQINCNECGMICDNISDLNNHVNNEHEDRSREVCRQYKRGNCFRGNNCKFAHVGYQNISENSNNSNGMKSCRNGANCRWHARGICKFKHDENQNQNNSPQTSQSSQSRRLPGCINQTENNSRQCWYKNNCRRAPNCPFSHMSMTDFPSLPRREGIPQVWNQNNGRFSQKI